MLLEHLLSSSSSAAPLRIALLLDRSSLPRPHAMAVEHVLRSDFARVVLLVYERRARARRSSRAVNLPSRTPVVDGSPLLFRWYERWDRRHSSAADGLLRPVGLDGRLEGVPSLTVETIAAPDGVRYPQEAMTRIGEHGIDVAIRFASDRLAADAPRIARFGVWSYHQGDGENYRDGPAHFWELAEDDPVSGVTLEMESQAEERPMVLCRGLAQTAPGDAVFALTQNRVKPHLLGSTFVIRKLKELHEHGFASLQRGADIPSDRGKRRKIHGAPSNVEMAMFLGRRLARKARTRLLEPHRLVQWRVATRVNGSPRFEAGRRFDLEGFRWIEAPRGRLYADPFLIERNGKTYCFFEDLDHARHVGRISCAVVDGAGQLQDVTPVLELPHHLSYPSVFEDDGEIFMVPESRRHEKVELFRAVEFPARWEKVRTLLDGAGLDTTVLRHGGRYWFFVAVREPEEAGEQLLLFHAESLTHELRFHPCNPISTDVRTCRPAGAIFAEGGRLIRPSQDGSVTYGRRLNFHEIVSLTPDEYREELVTTVDPPRGMDGIHTYNRCGAVEVIDGKRLEPVSRHGAKRR